MGGLNSGYGGMGLSLISTGIGAFGAYREAQAANSAAEYNAREYQYKADQTRTRGMFDLTLLRREHKQNLSALTQGVVNSGVEAGSGSAIRLLSSQKGMDVKAEQIQQYNTELEATGYERQASMIRAQKTNPFAAAFKTLMGGVQQTFNQYDKYRMYTGARTQASSLSSCYWPS
jgi:hypothetical protein